MIAEDPADDAPSPDEVRSAVERLVASDGFRTSPQLAAFLSFVAEAMLRGESKRIKAYTIAVEALGRGQNFDPEADSIVRAVAGRLRRALAHYYATAGAGETIVVDLPRGSYVPVFRRRSVTQGPPAAAAAQEGPPAAAHRVSIATPRRIAALAAILLVVIAAIGLLPFWTKVGGAAKAPSSGLAPAGLSPLAVRPGPVVSVQPFETAGGPPKPAFSVEQLREELTDAMARFDGINGVADLKPSDGSSDWSEYRLSGRAEYGADGALSFSFRLVDAADGTVVWSRVFPNLQGATNPDAARDSIVREVASTIAEPFGILWTRELSDHTDRDPRRTCLVETVEYWRRFRLRSP